MLMVDRTHAHKRDKRQIQIVKNILKLKSSFSTPHEVNVKNVIFQVSFVAICFHNNSSNDLLTTGHYRSNYNSVPMIFHLIIFQSYKPLLCYLTSTYHKAQ